MPRSCSICQHPEREAVDLALVVDNASYRAIARQFGVSKDAVRRHADEHLPQHLARAQDAQEVAEADDLLAQVRDLQARTLAILEAAETTSQHRTALSAIREARSNLELLAKLVGELDERPVNVLIAPEWLELRAVIVGALAPHQEARSAVLGVIGSAGDGRA